MMIWWFKRCVLKWPLKICDDNGEYVKISRITDFEDHKEFGSRWTMLDLTQIPNSRLWLIVLFSEDLKKIWRFGRKKKKRDLKRRSNLKKIWKRFKGEKYGSDLLDAYLK